MKPPYPSIYQAPKTITCSKHGSSAEKYGCKACRKEALDRHRSKGAPRNSQVDKRRRRKQTETPTTSQEE